VSQKQLTSTVLFADICDSTRLYDEQGDRVAYQVVSRVLERVAREVDNYEGRVIKSIGDGIIAVFEEVDKAVLGATAILAESGEDDIKLRVGLHFGPVIMVDGDVFGDVVNVASRVVSLAQSGELLVTGEVRESLSAILAGGLAYLDAIGVKGKPEPIQIYRLVAGETEATMVAATVTTAVTRALGAVLEVTGAGQTRRLDVPHQRLVIGRQADCDLVVQGQRISRQHARIEQAQGDFYIHDSSANGTYVRQTGGSVLALRRTSAPMGQAGEISLGVPPEKDEDYTLSYRVVTP
jgi:class 3 adenylate cyclase